MGSVWLENLRLVDFEQLIYYHLSFSLFNCCLASRTLCVTSVWLGVNTKTKSGCVAQHVHKSCMGLGPQYEDANMHNKIARSNSHGPMS